MKIAYLDTYAGVSGDMILGALLDSGLEADLLRSELKKLACGEFSLSTERVTRKGIAGTSVKIEYEEQDEHRHLGDIDRLIADSGLEPEIVERAQRVFTVLAEAEAAVHGTSVEEVHFHEVGAVDSIIDIVGSIIGFHHLGVEKVYASRIHTGTGFVRCAHGCIPVPAPATLELLRGLPFYSTGIETELATPTGTALLRVLVEDYGPCPEMELEAIGYGAGKKELPIPNLLRLLVGQKKTRDPLRLPRINC